jgi:hypothetical protein
LVEKIICFGVLYHLQSNPVMIEDLMELLEDIVRQDLLVDI